MLLSIKNKVVNSLKKQALFVCFFISFTPLLSQNNLVINGGFDSLTQCPSNVGDISKAYNWFQPIRNFSSSELFNLCSGVSSLVSVPKNVVGYQQSIGGDGYAGIGVYFSTYTNYREYIEAKLLSPLKADYTYCMEFYISLADTVNFAVSSIGAYFSNDSILIDNLPNNYLISVIPQIQNDSLTILSDKKNWTKISDDFVALGGEQFLTIGNFYDDNITTKHIIQVSNNSNPPLISANSAYYYIENIIVYACDSPLVEEPQDTTFVFIPNVFSPNQDGENDLWQVTANKVNNLKIQVFNRWGEQVYIFNSQNLQQDASTSLSMTYNPAWDGYTPTGKPVPEGTYFYIVQYTLPSGEVKVEKRNLTLLR